MSDDEKAEACVREEKPKCCPFCGGPASVGTERPGFWSVICGEWHERKCPAGPSVEGDTRAEAIAAWNKRSAPPASPAVVGGGAEVNLREVLSWAVGYINTEVSMSGTTRGDNAAADGVLDWLERADAALASPSPPQPAEAETGVVAALKDCAAFIAVMFGDVNGTVPEAVITPIGVQVKLGQLMREASAALAPPSGGEADHRKGSTMTITDKSITQQTERSINPCGCDRTGAPRYDGKGTCLTCGRVVRVMGPRNLSPAEVESGEFERGYTHQRRDAKPCPFCGSAPRVIGGPISGYDVRCCNGDCITNSCFDTPSAALSAWEKRFSAALASPSGTEAGQARLREGEGQA